MKKGLSIGLGIGSGVCLLAGLAGVIYGLDGRVRSWFGKETGVYDISDTDLGEYKGASVNLIADTNCLDGANTGKQLYSDKEGDAYQRLVEVTGLPKDFTGCKDVRLKVVKGDENDVILTKEDLRNYGSYTFIDGADNFISISHTLFTQEAISDTVTLRLYMVAKPAIYKDYEFTFTSNYDLATETAYKAVKFGLDPDIPVCTDTTVQSGYRLQQHALDTAATITFKVTATGNPGKDDIIVTSLNSNVLIGVNGETPVGNKKLVVPNGGNVTIVFPKVADDCTYSLQDFFLLLSDHAVFTETRYRVSVFGYNARK
jgi:hypothetical protein